MVPRTGPTTPATLPTKSPSAAEAPRHHRDTRRQIGEDYPFIPCRRHHALYTAARTALDQCQARQHPLPTVSTTPSASTAMDRSRHCLSDGWRYDGKLSPALGPQPIPVHLDNSVKLQPHLETQPRSQVSPFCHMPVICESYQHIVHIFRRSVISLSYPCHEKLKKDIPGIYQSVSTSKKICQTSKRYPRVSFLVPNWMFLSYVLHIPVITFSHSAECGPH